MYMHYQNLLKRKLVLTKDTLQDYAQIERIGNHLCIRIDNQNYSKAILSNAQTRFEEAKTLIQRNKTQYHHFNIPINTNTKKWLLLTTMTFPDNEKFLNILKSYDITLEDCKLFSTQIDHFISHISEIQDPDDSLEWIIIEYLDIQKLKAIMKYYNLKNMEVIINKILEISYIHPEMLEKQKEK